MFTRMIVCEAMTDETVQKIVSRMQEYVRSIPDVVSHSLLAEEGGRMVILITYWKVVTPACNTTPAAHVGNSLPTRSTCWSEVTL